jgi:hypothetical protein
MSTKKDSKEATELSAEDYPMGKPLPPDQDPTFHFEEWPEAYDPQPVEGSEPAAKPAPASKGD